MRAIARILPLLFLSAATLAQKAPIKFGDIPMEDMKMKVYPRDSSASAVVLVDYGESTMEWDNYKGFIIKFERTKRIKILTKEGYSHANETVLVYHSGTAAEKLTGIKGVTYNLEGTKIVESKMDKDAIFNEKYDKSFDLYKFTLPNVKEGSIIEITYRLESEFIFNFQDWEFQSTIPTRWSEYRTKIPEYFNYDQYMQGYVPVKINEHSANTKNFIVKSESLQTGAFTSNVRQTSSDNVQYRELFSRWASEDVPAFKEEPFMNNQRDYISRMNFELISTQFPNSTPKYYRGSWENLNKEFLDEESFGGVVKGSGHLNRIVEDVLGGTTDPKEKITKIYSYVKSNVEWDGGYRYYSSGFKDALESKKGSSADINLMMVSMMQKAGLSANPVLISTRNHGFIREQYAISSQFNYVLASVILDNKVIILDATDRSLAMGVLPERCINGQGFIISADRSGWVKIAPTKSKVATNADLAMNAEGELTGKVLIKRDGYYAQKMRKNYYAKGEASYLNELSTSHQWELGKSSFENLEKVAEAAVETHDVTLPGGQAAGDVIYLNPILKDQITENPFKSETRLFPVDFGSASEVLFIGKYKVPEGYTVEELPKPKLVGLPNNGAKFVYSVVFLNNVIQLSSQITINQSLFSQEEYSALREFYNQVVAKQAEQIVIKKK